MSKIKQFLDKHRLPGERFKYYPYSKIPKSYIVSNLGRVISLKRKKPFFLKYNIMPNSGYCRVSVPSLLRKSLDSYVHTVVLETFVGICPLGLQCRHFDDIKSNNALDNLSWGTFQENADDKLRNGRVPQGANHYRSNFTDKEIKIILKDTRNNSDIAKHYGVSKSGIALLKRRYKNKYGKIVHINPKGVKGELHGHAKINERVVLSIRKSKLPRKELAVKYGISLSQVYKIQSKAVWAHV